MENLTSKEKSYVQVARKIKEMGLQQGDILVYAVIKNYRNAKTGRCNPGMDKELVPKTGYTKHFILKAIDRLENAGLITVIRQRGSSNQYTFKEIGEEFDRFARAFLEIQDLSPNTKEFYMKIQEFLYVNEDGSADTSYSLNQLATRADIDWKSAKKYIKELEEKKYVSTEETNLIEETGFKATRFVFDLQRLGQAVLYKLKEHDDSIQDLYQKNAEKDKKIVNLEREVESLKRQLRWKATKEYSFDEN